ncbi:MAG: exonuclease subunit SbcD [Escherichia coli]|nr:exonuclease subunit SbcD [Escherichia coli]
MRILHTSDWHLGQNFYSKSREAEHQAFLDWLLETAQTHQVDAIIVAGDVFDTGSPPSYARTLYNRFVVNLQQTGCHLVVLAGNHDSVATLNESRDIMAFLNTAPFRFYVHVTLLPARRGLTVLKNSSIYWQRLPIITNNTMPMPANCAAISLCPSSPRDI